MTALTVLLSRLAAGVAHELRNPLAVILARVQMLELALQNGRPPSPERLRQTLGTVQQQVLRASRVVETFTMFARPRAPEVAPVDLAELIARVFEGLRDRLPPDGRIRTAVDVAPEARTATADAGQLVIGLSHLVANAVEAMPEGGVLRVGARRRDGAVAIRVSDTGAGVPVEHAPRIFEPFFSTKPAAAGLGLPVAQVIAQSHGGGVRLLAAGGPGAEFELWLPDPGAAR